MEEEINLRELTEVLWRGRWTVVAIILIAVLVAGAASAFLLSPSYETSTMILVADPDGSVSTPQVLLQVDGQEPTEVGVLPEADDTEAILDRLYGSRVLSLDAYKAQATSDPVLNRVLEDLGLDMTREQLQARLEVRILEGTNLIEVKATDPYPEEAVQIANATSQALMEFVAQAEQERRDVALAALESRMTAERAELDAALAGWTAFLENGPSPAAAQAELEARTEALGRYKTELASLQVEVVAVQASIQALEDRQSTTALREELQRAHVREAELTARLAAIREAIVSEEEVLQDIEAAAAERGVEAEQLKARVDTLRANWLALSRKHDDIRLAGTEELAAANLSLIAPAARPSEPVGPRTGLNMAVAGVLGLMFSVFLVYFLEFWRASDPRLAGRPAESTSEESRYGLKEVRRSADS